GDQAGVNAIAAQAVDSALANGVSGQLGNESNIQTVVGQGNSHVGLAAAEGELQGVGLNKTLVVEGLQTDHQFAEGNNSHDSKLLFGDLFFNVKGNDLFLDQVNGEAGNLVSHVDGDVLAVLVDHAVHVELDTTAAQVIYGTVDVVALDGNVRSEEHTSELQSR